MDYPAWLRAVNKLLLARSAGFFIDPNASLLTDQPFSSWQQFYDAGWSPERMDAGLRDFSDTSTDPDGQVVRRAVRRALGLKDERRQQPRD